MAINIFDRFSKNYIFVLIVLWLKSVKFVEIFEFMVYIVIIMELILQKIELPVVLTLKWFILIMHNL